MPQDLERITIQWKSNCKRPYNQISINALEIQQEVDSAITREPKEVKALNRTVQEIKEIWEKNLIKLGDAHQKRILQEYFKLGEAILLHTANYRLFQQELSDRQFKNAIKIYYSFQKYPEIIPKLHKTHLTQFYYLTKTDVNRISQTVEVAKLLNSAP